MKLKVCYNCQVWCSAINLKDLKSWILLLPLYCNTIGLTTNIKRFTVLKSPLGNKKSKDQFEQRKYRSYFSVDSENSSKILALVKFLRLSSGVKLKIVLSVSNSKINEKKFN